MANTQRARPPNPHEMAMYGHIAARLRAFMEERGWKPADINDAMGIKRDNSAVYMWINARSAPGPQVAIKLAKIIGCKPAELRPAPYNPNPPGEGALVVAPSNPGPGRPPRAYLPAEALSFAITVEGRARVKLDVELTAKQGAALFALLMSANQLASIIEVEPEED